ncbi:hypothetical protein AQUCO_00200648v1 [Aquilegia coerulea]|uniref:Negatively light-regulated protein n=1 Tax=Aquilegia coerulea TaxID=218851 RepID=A0A2G5F483_AQUCA|nr:hypothetical protein AQUCO_00200648v1 [Aquilegia coerulea]PIA62772.1 hypothetical protein AQUCO_00200648v1 [Aquilegia coerulea]PIA62773.1 hypothetical protein AQUCO_00200648v1 [Aquilegia coerulea]PIA62775.1 hypothetical protein AQUCO_00200648v1 [Aquilegia coerulea]
MSGTNVEDVKEQELAEHNLEVQVDGEFPGDDTEHIEKKEENVMPSAQEEEAIIKKKYGGMLPRKPPLISKDHERAFFDSADWALGKQGAPVQKPKGPLEALRPKLQPTPHNQARSRRSAYAPADNEDDGGNNNNDSSEG